MALSEGAYPFEEGGKTYVMDPATGQRYDIDPGGQVLTPDGPEVPWWGAPTPTQPTATTPKATNPTFTPTAPPSSGLPSVDIQPGLNAQQWEGTYNLNLAAEKRLREIMETVTQPQARAAIDQAIQALRQQGFENQTNQWESQRKAYGFTPQWLPQTPAPATGAWKQYQTGGMVAPPGGGTTGGPAMTDEQAAQAIWKNDPQIQSMYQGQHPDWTPVQAVQDWWGWAPHEGAATIAQYAQKKGWT